MSIALNTFRNVTLENWSFLTWNFLVFSIIHCIEDISNYSSSITLSDSYFHYLANSKYVFYRYRGYIFGWCHIDFWRCLNRSQICSVQLSLITVLIEILKKPNQIIFFFLWAVLSGNMKVQDQDAKASPEFFSIL